MHALLQHFILYTIYYKRNNSICSCLPALSGAALCVVFCPTSATANAEMNATSDADDLFQSPVGSRLMQTQQLQRLNHQQQKHHHQRRTGGRHRSSIVAARRARDTSGALAPASCILLISIHPAADARRHKNAQPANAVCGLLPAACSHRRPVRLLASKTTRRQRYAAEAL
jgi:hypothetical protein